MVANNKQWLKFIKTTIGCLIITVQFMSCANITPLGGGDKDTFGPEVDTSASSKNFQTNFVKQDIYLKFDEWINLKDQSQILISPPLEFNPKFHHKGKEITINFDEKETLRKNTTYVIQLGESVTDFTEGNTTSGFNYVFSTGDKIDSLSIRGKIIDIFDNKPTKGISVMLFESDIDSTIYKDRPFYLTTSDSSGHFKLENLKTGDYKLIAIEDNNKNYSFDPTSEKIGFLDSMIHIGQESAFYLLEMSLETPPLKLISEEQEKDGYIELIYNKRIENIDSLYINMDHQKIISKDSILIWYKADTTISQLITYNQDSIELDYLDNPIETIRIQFPKASIHPSDTLTFVSKHLIQQIDTSKITLKDTSGFQLPLNIIIDSIDGRKIMFQHKWKEKIQYQIDMLPGAIVDYYGNINDSLSTTIKVADKNDFGTILLHLDRLDSLYHYKIDLSKKKQIIKSFYLKKGIEKLEIVIPNLREGNYSIQIIEDIDEDGYWSPANYLNKTKAEKILNTTSGQLRKNWDLDVNISFLPIKKEITPALDSISVDVDSLEQNNQIEKK